MITGTPAVAGVFCVCKQNQKQIVHQKNTTDFKYISGKPSILYPCFEQNIPDSYQIFKDAELFGTQRGKGEKRVNQKGKFRHELKYRISYGQYIELRNRLRTVMRSDLHTGVDGRYLIRSIYFDNYMDKALREKADGVPKREKFRIRYYNDDFSYLTLEKKIKDNALCMKVDAQIAEKECRALLEGNVNWMREHPAPLVRELYAKMRYQMLLPRVLVSYMREPYIYQAGNVRITFDSNIRTTLFHREFLEKQVTDIDTAGEPREMILEVKYDAFLPEIIRSLVQINTPRQTAFSKYEACRQFG